MIKNTGLVFFSGENTKETNEASKTKEKMQSKENNRGENKMTWVLYLNGMLNANSNGN